MTVMSGLDARFLFSETPTAHMHTMKVVVVDVSGRSEPLSPADLPAQIEDHFRRIPVLRRLVVPIPHRLGNPVIIDDPEFDLSRHLRSATVAAPGGPRQLDSVIATIAGTPLPRDRPLWELTVVDGLSDGRIAFVVKLHHALADGVAAVALLEHAFMAIDADAVAEANRPDPVPTNRELYLSAARGAVRAAAGLPRVAGRTARGELQAIRARRSEPAPPPGPFAGPRTPFNTALTPDRTFATVSLPVPSLAAVKQAAGATLNDAFLALVGGATRRYLERVGSLPTTSLTAAVPTSTRAEHHEVGGNHVDNVFVPLRSDLADPNERVAAIHEAAAAARRVRGAFGPDLFEARSGILPPVAHWLPPRLWSASHLANRVRPPVNLVASCVRGPRARLEFDGGYVASLFSSGPILEGIGVNVTAWTYVDTMYVSILGCSASLPDPSVLADDMEAELADWSDHS